MKFISCERAKNLSLILLVAVLAGITFFSHLGNQPLFNPDEGLYAEPAREMLDTGEYITTLLNYVVRFTKPPLVIWAMALSYKIFGVNEFAARFCCAASGFLLTLVTYLFAWKYLGHKTAIIAACILITAPLFVGVGHMAITDMPLSFFIAGCLFSFFHAWQQKKRFWLWTGYVLVGLAIMTKGPVGLILPGLILAVFFLLCARGKKVLDFLSLGWGSLIVAVIALPWFAIEIAITHGAYFREFILRENFARFTSVVDAHKGHWWYHLAAVFGGLFPWSILLPQSIVTTIKTVGFTRIDNHSQQLTIEKQTVFFLLLCAVITIVFFSASVSKLLPYTLPAFPALAIIIARQWQIFMESNKKTGMVVYCSIFFVVYLCGASIAPIALQYLRSCPPHLIQLLVTFISALTVLALVVLIILAITKSKAFTSFVLFGSLVIFSLIATPKILWQVSQFWEGSIADYARFARHAGRPLIVYRLRKPAVPFYFAARVLHPGNKEELEQTLRQQGQCYLISSTHDLAFLKSSGCRMIASDTNFAFLLSPDRRQHL